MFSSGSFEPVKSLNSWLNQPMLGESVRVQAMAISRPGRAKEISAREWKTSRPGASVRSTTKATAPPMRKVSAAVPPAKISELA